MNQKHLAQLWQWLSVFGLLFLLSTVVSIQGGSDFLGKLFGEMTGNVADNKPAVGYFGAIIGGALLFVSTCALMLHARRHGDSWHERIPVLWLDGLNTSSWEGRTFQLTILVLFLILPAAAVVRCVMEAEQGDICESMTTRSYDGEKTSLIWPPAAMETDKGHQMRLRSGHANPASCEGGVQIFPRIGTPLLAYGLPSLGLGTGLVALIYIFRRRHGTARS